MFAPGCACPAFLPIRLAARLSMRSFASAPMSRETVRFAAMAM
jgi:hypothetical protein